MVVMITKEHLDSLAPQAVALVEVGRELGINIVLINVIIKFITITIIIMEIRMTCTLITKD